MTETWTPKNDIYIYFIHDPTFHETLHGVLQYQLIR